MSLLVCVFFWHFFTSIKANVIQCDPTMASLTSKKRIGKDTSQIDFLSRNQLITSEHLMNNTIHQFMRSAIFLKHINLILASQFKDIQSSSQNDRSFGILWLCLLGYLKNHPSQDNELGILGIRTRGRSTPLKITIGKPKKHSLIHYPYTTWKVEISQLPCIGLSWPLTNRHLLGVVPSTVTMGVTYHGPKVPANPEAKASTNSSFTSKPFAMEDMPKMPWQRYWRTTTASWGKIPKKTRGLVLW